MSITNFLVFTIVSSVEYVAIFSLVFSLFRIGYDGYKPHIAFVCIALSYLSYSIREDSLSFSAPLIQIIVLIVLMWLLFRFQIFYSAIMIVTGYLAYALIQGFVIFVASIFFNNIAPFSIELRIIALVSATITFLLVKLIRRKNWGFAFVPHSDNENVNMKQKENMLLLIVMIISLVGFVITYSLTIAFDTKLSFIITVAFLCLAVTILVFVSQKKEDIEVG